jgi:DNA-binding HxlR family transcriptional regulator
VKWSDLVDSDCAVARSLSVVGDRWTLLLVREAFLGATRFGELCDNTGAARHIVANRLATLVDHGLVRREPATSRWATYHLTEKGRSLLPVVIALLDWGDSWMSHGRRTGLRFIHAGCGGAVDPALRCRSCHQTVANDAIGHRFFDGDGPDQRDGLPPEPARTAGARVDQTAADPG